MFGLSADYIKIDRIVKNYSLKILEDATQGIGGILKGKNACSFGETAKTFFFPTKPLCCYGDGGAVLLIIIS